jgi:hypothetical protein
MKIKSLAIILKYSLACFAILQIQACSLPMRQACCSDDHQEKLISVMGYAAKSQYKNLSESERILRAMQDAKENAYRNMLERIGEISVHYAASERKINAKDGEKDSALIINIAGSLQGVRLIHLIPLNDDIFEAKVEINLNDPRIYRSLDNKAEDVLEDLNKERGEPTDKKNPGNKFMYWIGL